LKSLYLRVWLTVVVVLALFALGSGWLWQRHVEGERARVEALVTDRVAAWGELIGRSLPEADAPPAEQAGALLDWAERLRLPLALDDARGQRIAASPRFERIEDDGGAARRIVALRLEDGRTLHMIKRGWLRHGMAGPHSPSGPHRPEAAAAPGHRAEIFGGTGPLRQGEPPAPRWSPPPWAPPWVHGTGWLLLVLLLFAAIAAGAYPVVRRLTRRLEALREGVERFGAGDLGRRVDASGRDEVAAVAASFNRAAERVESLLRSHQSLLANASHELRSPLARLKMALAMLDGAEGERRAQLQREIDTDIAELDALVEEVLLASRLDAGAGTVSREPVDLHALAVEEAARAGAAIDDAAAPACIVNGDERLLRRALRNLLDNARRHGGGDVTLAWQPQGAGAVIRVSDRGPGVPEAYRERIFEPFFRLPGHGEREGGVGLGLSLVRQIAGAHGGRVRCEAREGGGSRFVMVLPE